MAKGKVAEVIGLGALASGIAAAYKFSEFIVRLKKLHEVGGENAVFARLIQRVRVDLHEVERLLRIRDIQITLSRMPAKREWIYKTVQDTKVALSEIGRLTVRVTGDLDEGSHVGLRHRLRWLLDEHEKLVHRQMELATCHASLMEAMGYLMGLEPEQGRERGFERETTWEGGDSRYTVNMNVEEERNKFVDEGYGEEIEGEYHGRYETRPRTNFDSDSRVGYPQAVVQWLSANRVLDSSGDARRI
jgi:hypothetical protein